MNDAHELPSPDSIESNEQELADNLSNFVQNVTTAVGNNSGSSLEITKTQRWFNLSKIGDVKIEMAQTDGGGANRQNASSVKAIKREIKELLQESNVSRKWFALVHWAQQEGLDVEAAIAMHGCVDPNLEYKEGRALI